MLASLKHAVGRVLSPWPAAQTLLKRTNERLFWRKTLLASGGTFWNAHLEQFYTTFFSLDRVYYDGKRIVDVGCGPVGSLEWAGNAGERIGVDPLAEDYVRMNRGRHAMKYVKGTSEHIPFADGHFDVVTIFNALDHVEDVAASARELTRVCRVGGDLLLIVEINHKPTITEPHTLDADMIKMFENCEIVTSRIFGIAEDHNVYQSLIDQTPHKIPQDEGILCVHLRRIA